MDGTVGVGHSGVEVGQGINTKVAQCVAHELGIPLDLIAIDPTNSFIATNADPTGGSITSGLNRCIPPLFNILQHISNICEYVHI